MRAPDGWWVTPATIKAVIVHDGAVLLGRNPRGHWELPGGRPNEGEASVADVLLREVREETGLTVVVGRLLLADLFEVVPGIHLLMVALQASLADGVVVDDARSSDEHTDLRWFAVDALPEPLPEIYRIAIENAETARDRPSGAGTSDVTDQ